MMEWTLSASDSTDRLPLAPRAGTQGLWMATQGQLKSLQQKCKYLKYDEGSNIRFVERLSGSLEMYSAPCKVTKASEDT